MIRPKKSPQCKSEKELPAPGATATPLIQPLITHLLKYYSQVYTKQVAAHIIAKGNDDGVNDAYQLQAQKKKRGAPCQRKTER